MVDILRRRALRRHKFTLNTQFGLTDCLLRVGAFVAPFTLLSIHRVNGQTLGPSHDFTELLIRACAKI